MSDRLNDYFAREAAEYLEELERLLAASGAPEPDQFLRLVTGVRGSAQMAEAEGVVVLAGALEDAARGVASGDTEWSEELHSLAAGTVHDLKALVATLGRWGSAEEETLRGAVSRWGQPGLKSSTSPRDDEPVPISDLFYDDAGPHIIDVDPAAVDPTPPGLEDVDRARPVPIGDLLYEGPAAIREALALRSRVEEAARQGSSPALDDLLQELFDLVELGMGSDRPE